MLKTLRGLAVAFREVCVCVNHDTNSDPWSQLFIRSSPKLPARLVNATFGASYKTSRRWGHSQRLDVYL